MKYKVGGPEKQISNGFENPGEDIFGNRDLIVRLTGLYKSFEHGTVAVLDGRWGTGKSTFAKAWMSHLASSEIPSIYFDAFASDYIDSPFEALASSFVNAVKKDGKAESNVYRNFLSAASKVGTILAITTAKVGIKAVTLGAIDHTDVKALTDVGQDIADGLSDGTEDAIKKLLEAQAERDEKFEALRQSLAKLPELLSPNSNDPKIVVVIDELDRCRPDFALGIVESLKHFFSVANVHFLLVTNLNHLEKSVSSRYGLTSDSAEYLEKFYDFVINFGMQYDKNSYRQIERFIRMACDKVITSNEDTRADISGYVEDIAPAFNLSLRQIETLISNLSLVYSARSENERFDNFLVVFLLVLKIRAPSLYARARNGSLSHLQAMEFFGQGSWRDSQTGERVLKVFEYYLSPNINQHSDEWQGYNRHSRLGRLETIPYCCKSVIERFSAKIAQS